jgi:hypothetical protein
VAAKFINMHMQFINAHKFRVRPSYFGAVSRLPDDVPEAKLSFLMGNYLGKITDEKRELKKDTCSEVVILNVITEEQTKTYHKKSQNCSEEDILFLYSVERLIGSLREHYKFEELSKLDPSGVLRIDANLYKWAGLALKIGTGERQEAATCNMERCVRACLREEFKDTDMPDWLMMANIVKEKEKEDKANQKKAEALAKREAKDKEEGRVAKTKQSTADNCADSMVAPVMLNGSSVVEDINYKSAKRGVAVGSLYVLKKAVPKKIAALSVVRVHSYSGDKVMVYQDANKDEVVAVNLTQIGEAVADTKRTHQINPPPAAQDTSVGA